LLSPDGLIVSTTQKFRLDESLAHRFEVRDISAATLPKDFGRNPRIHKCFEVRKRA
jgi:23S rRNA (guanine2445-N2)-methyltransferase / 23S rRNA (guanine2069-N7)-methyltransferase